MYLGPRRRSQAAGMCTWGGVEKKLGLKGAGVYGSIQPPIFSVVHFGAQRVLCAQRRGPTYSVP